MPPRFLSVDELAVSLCAEARKQADALAGRGRNITISAIMIGGSPAAAREAAARAASCREVGIGYAVVELPADLQKIDAKMDELAADNCITGVMFLPGLPEHLPQERAARRIPARKDVMGIHPAALGAGILDPEALLPPLAQAVATACIANSVDLYDRRALVIGHLKRFVLPLGAALAARHALVTLASPDSAHLREECLRNDIIIADCLPAGSINAVKPGSVLFDLAPASSGARDYGAFTSAAVDSAAWLLPCGGIEILERALFLQNAVESARQVELPATASSAPPAPERHPRN